MHGRYKYIDTLISERLVIAKLQKFLKPEFGQDLPLMHLLIFNKILPMLSL